jgi:hypothetical protein
MKLTKFSPEVAAILYSLLDRVKEAESQAEAAKAVDSTDADSKERQSP